MRLLKACCWLVAIVLGGMQAWVGRHAMGPDGVSYLDMGEAYWRGDWSMAINAYWSPLYSWLLGFAMNALKPSPYWEFAVVHLVNFIIYLCALLCFDFLLRQLIRYRKVWEAEGNSSETSFPDWLWVVLGYLLFTGTTLLMITLDIVQPDLCVAALVFLAAEMLLRIRMNAVGYASYILLGLILGLAYLSKAAMFPLSFVFLGVTLFLPGDFRQALPRSLVALAVFLALAAPLILALSVSKHRLTFGDAGKLNYAWEVNGFPKYIHWQGEPPGSGIPMHPTRKLLEEPATYEFAAPVGGSYPPWYDASYWYEGITPRFDLSRQLAVLKKMSGESFYHFISLWSGLFVPLYFLLLLNRRKCSFRKMVSRSWFLLVPALAAILMYSLVFVWGRYIAPFVALVWLSLFTGIDLPGALKPRKWLDYWAVPAALLVICLIVFEPPFYSTVRDFIEGRAQPAPAQWEIAEGEIRSASAPVPQWEIADGLNRMGVEPGEKIASIGETVYTHWYRLAHVQVVAEIPATGEGAFWRSDATVKAHVMRLFAEAGARAVVAHRVPSGGADGWRRIGNTGAHVYFLSR